MYLTIHLDCSATYGLVQEYLSAAVTYLEGDETELKVEDIRGIWVASDDSGVVDRIKEIAPRYLPNVDNSTIFWASGGVEGGPEIRGTATRTDHEVKEGGGEQDRVSGEVLKKSSGTWCGKNLVRV